MKRIFYTVALALVSFSLSAQETYDNANIATEDLNGTARYVGMGGAMDALGADISTIGSNPSGMGLFRKSNAFISLGIVSQQGAQNFGGRHTTNVSFDQIGFVWSNRIGEAKFINFGFNYHKSRNFNQIMQVAGALDNASQNKVTTTKSDQGLLYYTKKDGSPDFDNSYTSCSILDDLYARNLNWNATDKKWYFYNGEEYAFDRSQYGYISEFDFNLSGNVNNSFYWGFTVGVKDVNYNRYTEYSENLIGGLGGVPAAYGVTITDDRLIRGTGFDLKFGAIFRPINDSPFRFGVYIHTPTWYNLRTSSNTRFDDNTGVKDEIPGDEYKFRLFTPWKFGVSAGHTVGNVLALGIGYEFANYSALDTRNLRDGGYGDYSYSNHDRAMNDHTSKTLRGVSTVKVGVELKPDPIFAIRLGYNFVSPMYKQDAFKDTWIDSMGAYHSSTSDFTNWDALHRITCGFGIQINKWNVSMAYQYSVQKGSFAPFDSYTDSDDPAYSNIADMMSITHKRHQALLTLGYTF